MYPVGVPIAAKICLALGFGASFFLALVILSLLLYALPHSLETKATVATFPGCSLFNIWRFFDERFDFLNSGFTVTSENVFQFQLLQACAFGLRACTAVDVTAQHTVIAVSGESARKAFFTMKGFDLTEGFKILSGAVS